MHEPNQFDLWTGGKQNAPELTIFYNVAFDRTKKLRSGTDLCDYLWKAYTGARNKSEVYQPSYHERNMARQMVEKLEEIRNFHSHIYHDDKALVFSLELKTFVEKLYMHAVHYYMETHSRDIDHYNYICDKKAVKSKRDDPRTLFEKHGQDWYITGEGRAFFLGFFLHDGEMTALLQQRSGSKQNKLSEHKIKHLIFRHYTHREAASRKQYLNAEGNMLESFDEERKKEVASIRQAYKIMTYLRDAPQLGSDLDLMPLMTENGEPITNVNQLVSFCKVNNLLQDWEIKNGTSELRENRPQIIFLNQLILTVKREGKSCQIQIQLRDLLRTLLDGIRTGNGDQHIRKMVDMFIIDRREMIEALKHIAGEGSHDSEETEDGVHDIITRLGDKNRYKYRCSEELSDKLSIYLSQLQRDGIRNNNYRFQEFLSELKEAPIEINYYSFFNEQDYMPRKENSFVWFAVKYLIDFGIVPKWEWGFQLSTNKDPETGKPPKVFYSSVWSEKESLRLALTDEQQVLVRFENRIYLLGPLALLNLMAAHLDNKPISEFLDKLGRDMENVDLAIVSKSGLPDNLTLLTPRELPRQMLIRMKAQQEPQSAELISKAVNRIERIIKDELLPIVDGSAAYRNRAEKNRQIMRLYLFFDWQYSHSNEFKFLRKDEYQLMSTFHYSIEKGKSNQAYKYLLEGILPHAPEELKDIWKNAVDLDDILFIVAGKCITLMDQWKGLLESDVPKFANKRDILKKLSITVPSIEKKESRHLAKIPFDIHPILPVRAFYAKEMDTAEEKGKGFSLTSRLWKNKNHIDALYNKHYLYEPYLNMLPESDEKKKRRKKVIGAYNRLISDDIVLFELALKYLNKVRDAEHQAIKAGKDSISLQIDQALRTGLREGQNFRKLEVVFKPLDTSVFRIRMKMHQLDNYLMHPMDKLEKAGRHLLRRWELEKDPDKKNNYQVKYDPAGKAPHHELLIDEINKEVKRISEVGINVARHILAWEYEVLKASYGKGALEAYLDSKEKNRIDFRGVIQAVQAQGSAVEICKRCGVNSTDTNDHEVQAEPDKGFCIICVRNKTFHQEIPDQWTYMDIEKDGALYRLIGYVPRSRRIFAIQKNAGKGR